jgi:hypothetical protein
MHLEDDPRQRAVSDLSKVTLCLVAPRFKQHNDSAIAALDNRNSLESFNLIGGRVPVHLKKFESRDENGVDFR